MLIAHLLRLVDQERKLFVAVRWKGLSKLEDTLEPLVRVYENVPELTRKFLISRALRPPFALRCTLH